MYTVPKGWAYYNILSNTPAYAKLMKNNVDLLSKSMEISIEKTLNTSRSAIFIGSTFFDWGQAYSKRPELLSCLVRLNDENGINEN